MCPRSRAADHVIYGGTPTCLPLGGAAGFTGRRNTVAEVVRWRVCDDEGPRDDLPGPAGPHRPFRRRCQLLAAIAEALGLPVLEAISG